MQRNTQHRGRAFIFFLAFVAAFELGVAHYTSKDNNYEIYKLYGYAYACVILMQT